MTDRKKLIELIFKGEDTTPCTRNPEFECDGIKCFSCEREAIADYLLNNGVTFATDTNDGCKWISVEDRLPVETYQVLTVDDTGWIEIDALGWEDWLSHRDVTHWMPLPEPPKEEQHGS